MEKDYGWLYKLVRSILRFFGPRFSVWDSRTTVQKEEGPVVYVSHHQNLFGPVVIHMWYPVLMRTWILNVFMGYRTCYRQYVDYTFTKRMGWPRLLAQIAAVPAAWFASALTKSTRGIPVYRQSRLVMETMKKTVEALQQGENILLFPDVQYDDEGAEVKEIYEGFLYVEKYYFKATGKHIPFVPLFADKREEEIRVGEPIFFEGKEKFFTERKQVAEKLQEELNRLANVKKDQDLQLKEEHAGDTPVS